jgi:hypothetical protein
MVFCPEMQMNVVKAHADIVLTSNSEMEQFSLRNDKYNKRWMTIKTFVIAEIGCNHKGDMETAKELIKIAKIFLCWCCKVSKRNNKNY